MNTAYLARSLATLESSLDFLRNAPNESTDFEVYRNAVVKGFELSLEIAGKLLRKALKSYTTRPREIDSLTFKDIFRHASKHDLLDSAAVQRWFSYRENRNDTAHDYGIAFAEETLRLLPSFLADARALEEKLRSKFDD